MAPTYNDSLLQQSGWVIQLVTYLTHVMFYLRFVFIYLFSTFLELMGVGAHTQFWFFLGGIIITAAILHFFVDTEQPEKLNKIFNFINDENLKVDLTPQESWKLIFYSLIEYIFYTSMLFGLARQILLYMVSQQSQAIALMALYQQVILVGAAYFAIFFTWVHYQHTLKNYMHQKAVFQRLTLENNTHSIQCNPISLSWQLILFVMCLSISAIALFGFQYYLSAGQVLFPPYMISWLVAAGVLALSLSFTFLYQDPLCRSLLWCGFITMSATLGMFFLGKIVYMALLGHLASGFYHSIAIASYMGVSVACGILYGQIMLEFTTREIYIAKIYDGASDAVKSLNKTENAACDQLRLQNYFTNCTESADTRFITP